MGTTFLAHWIPNDIIKATAWTLLHSAWIGLLFAAAAGLVITLAKKASARLRYHLLCALLMSFVLVMIFTFLREIRINNNSSASAATFGTFAAIARQAGITRQLIAWLNQQSAVIFLIWLLFFIIKSARLTGGLFYINIIRTSGVKAIPEKWQKKVDEFCTKISISRPVTLLQSELVKVPVAIGWLKPVILLPVGIIFQLSAEQVESILLHELAHIRRLDYLVNVMQGIVEAVFFFNPALLWLSSLIRNEREACCDDVVLAHVARKSDYLEALLALGSNPGKVNLAMSLASDSNQLKSRLKRMIYRQNQPLSMREIFSLLLGLIFIMAFTVFPDTQAVATYKQAHAIKGEYLKVAGYTPQRNAKKDTPVTHKNKLTDKEVNGVKMFGHEMAANYQDMVSQIDQALSTNSYAGKTQHIQNAAADTTSIEQLRQKSYPKAMGADSTGTHNLEKNPTKIKPIYQK